MFGKMVMSIYEARQQHMLPGVENAIYSSVVAIACL